MGGLRFSCLKIHNRTVRDEIGAPTQFGFGIGKWHFRAVLGEFRLGGRIRCGGGPDYLL